MSDIVQIHDVCLVSDEDWLTAGEICRLCRLDLEAVIEFADLGLIAPRGHSPEQWQLPAAALPRLAIAGRLMRDLGVNASGAVLVIELLDTRRELERELERLARLAPQ